VAHKPLAGTLVLELFPGDGLFGRAFAELGACVVNAGDIMQGYDIREFRGIAGRFDGVIGGPPCQFASVAARGKSRHQNLIPEFERVVSECKPRWAVMENVVVAWDYAPREWPLAVLRDWDCGGLTHRRRAFWFYGLQAPPPPRQGRSGEPYYSALASLWNKRKTSFHIHAVLTAAQSGWLQGYSRVAKRIYRNQPGWRVASGNYDGVSRRAREVLAVHMMGNGVPRAMGLYVAQWVAFCLYDYQPPVPMQYPLWAVVGVR